MSQGKFEGPISVVVTSISAPNSELRELSSQCQSRGYPFLVIGDVPSPTDFSIDGCDFYGLDRQQTLGFRSAELLPLRHYSRKNLGYLLAIRAGCRMLLETDDDNTPLPDFWCPREREQEISSLADNGWTNVYRYFTDAHIWPRGLPLDSAQAELPGFELLPQVQVKCPIQQGLADEDPDVDAIYRLLFPLPISFRKDRRVALQYGSWCPFNSQNTAWFPEAYPLLYLPSYCSIRMTDIWRSFVAQRIAWENGWAVLFKGPDVYQERNAHNLMRDFADEVPGYLNNRIICERLADLKLQSGTEYIGDAMLRCYEELIRIEMMPAKELTLLLAWLDDLSG